jgi:hypothetical protein
VQLLLGHTKLEGTVRYLGIEVEDAPELGDQTEAWQLARHGRIDRKSRNIRLTRSGSLAQIAVVPDDEEVKSTSGVHSLLAIEPQRSTRHFPF